MLEGENETMESPVSQRHRLHRCRDCRGGSKQRGKSDIERVAPVVALSSREDLADKWLAFKI